MSWARSSAAEARTATSGHPAHSSPAGSTAGTTADAGLAPGAAILIPAYDEQATIATVVRAALASGLGPVIVIDDGSRDATARAAAAAGADVVTLDANRGKGGALDAGARHATREFVVLLDADLVGLTPEHVRTLAGPVIAGAADMSRGVFRGGRWATSMAQRVTPQLNGQRCLRRTDLLSVPGLAASRYGVEVAITRHGMEAGWDVVEVPLWGVTQVMKEEKRGLLKGLGVRARMYAQILGEIFKPRR